MRWWWLGCALVLAPMVARADDACLAGGLTLTDTRALAALQASLEAACPCSAYDGSPELDRGAYRTCAKAVVGTALDGGALRSRCRGRAGRLYRKATCGTDRIACGLAKTNATQKASSCRVQPASACADRPAVRETICSAETFCDEVTQWTAGTCVNPRQRVSPVGVRIFTRSKPSQVDPLQTRTLDTVVWYPTATPGAEDPTYDAVVDALLDGSAHPLLMFSHGACGRPTNSTFLLPLIASFGYVVASVPHPGNTLDDPGCLSDSALVASAYERPADIIFVVNELLAANADAGSPFFDAVDADRIGMSGHSFGGWTTYYVASLDARFKVAVILAGGVPVAVSSVSIPSLHMLGEIDSVSISGITNIQRAQAYVDSAPPKFYAEILAAGHFAFSDACFPGAPECAPPATLTQDEAHAIVQRWVVPFLERYLRGDSRFDAFLVPPAPAGVLFDARP